MKTITGKNFETTYQGGKVFKIKPEESNHPHSSYGANIEHIINVYNDKNDQTFYNISYLKGISKYIKEKYNPNKEKPVHKKNYVLIIDEINRGNISRIFGELITLIEKSKRLGNEEGITVTLPYSEEDFGIPNNLYIIGTMNTADRSIALLDTALRRRFRFEEMMPDLEQLNDIKVGEIKIKELLSSMNQRIEALYDRDHQIGHSCFLVLKNNENIETLKDIFKYEILPLLQEYFYDDWEKIDLVMNRNNFLKSKNLANMKDNDFVDKEKKLWSVDEQALSQPELYEKIYTDV